MRKRMLHFFIKILVGCFASILYVVISLNLEECIHIKYKERIHINDIERVNFCYIVNADEFENCNFQIDFLRKYIAVDTPNYTGIVSTDDQKLDALNKYIKENINRYELEDCTAYANEELIRWHMMIYDTNGKLYNGIGFYQMLKSFQELIYYVNEVCGADYLVEVNE